MSSATKIDRAAAVRRALVELVAENGFRGTSMSAVAKRAGVAAGTAYVHYVSKDELIVAAYVEVKRAMDIVAVAAVDPSRPAKERFLTLWRAILDHLIADPVRARFILQVNASPYRRAAQAAVLENADDPIFEFAETEDFASRLVDLPATVLYDLGVRPAISVAAGEQSVSDQQLTTLALACWRAVTRHDVSDDIE